MTLTYPPSQTYPRNPKQANTAFLLGWAISETLGRYRRGIVPQSFRQSTGPADSAPRLLVATGSVEKSGDAFEFAARRVCELYRVLAFESGNQVSPLTQSIYELPQQIHNWLEGTSSKFYTQRELRDLLNEWSLQVWARLDGISADSARALNSGMSLADTFWYLRPPSRRPKEALSEESFRRMLSKYRLEAERARLQSLSECLPAFVVPVIQRQLRSWSIGTELGYRNGELVHIRNGNEREPLTKTDEVRVQRALRRQVRNWELLIFGMRQPTSFLLAQDRRWIAILRWVALFVTLFLTSLFLIVLSQLAAYFIAVGPLPGLIRFFNEQQAHFSEYLAVVSLLWTILIASPLPLVLRAAYQGTRGIQVYLDQALTIWFIARRSHVPWDTYVRKEQKRIRNRSVSKTALS
ncbi:MAG TPA: hypothetical protein VF932_15150 [Anaerolineae bacterium]